MQLKRTPKNRIIVNNFTRKADMYHSIDRAENVSDLLDEIVKYASQFRDQYQCSNIINMLEKDYTRSFAEDELLTCREVYAVIGKGYSEYIELMISYSKGEYEKCVEVIEEDSDKYKKLLSNKFFLANIYDKAGFSDKAIDVLKTAIKKKPGEPYYYYKLAALLATKDPKSAKENLDIALKYWSKADEDFIPLQRAKELANSLTL